MSAHDIDPVVIKHEPLQVYESFNAYFVNPATRVSVRRDGQDGYTVLSFRSRGGLSGSQFELTDDELQALAQMLTEAYESQPREA